MLLFAKFLSCDYQGPLN